MSSYSDLRFSEDPNQMVAGVVAYHRKLFGAHIDNLWVVLNLHLNNNPLTFTLEGANEVLEELFLDFSKDVRFAWLNTVIDPPIFNPQNVDDDDDVQDDNDKGSKCLDEAHCSVPPLVLAAIAEVNETLSQLSFEEEIEDVPSVLPPHLNEDAVTVRPRESVLITEPVPYVTEASHVFETDLAMSHLSVIKSLKDGSNPRLVQWKCGICSDSSLFPGYLKVHRSFKHLEEDPKLAPLLCLLGEPIPSLRSNIPTRTSVGTTC